MNMFGASSSIICLSYVKAYHTYCGLNKFMMFALISSTKDNNTEQSF